MKSGDVVTAGATGAARNFVLGDVLGRGLWGVSWTARDAAGRDFVVKVPLEEHDVPADAPLPAGVLAACAAALVETGELYAKGHAWLPRLEAIGTTAAGAPALVMPRYPMSLKRRIAASVPLSEGVVLLQRVLDVLATAGRLHGDLRPSNVLINDRGEPVLADPLPAAIAAHRARLAEIAGSDRDEYGPPEGTSASADTFALCALLYRMAMIASPAGPAGAPRREDRIPIPHNGLDKVEIASLRDRVLTRLKDDAANPRFAARMADRTSALLNRGLSREIEPSPPYRFAELSALAPRLEEVAELVDPQVADVGHLLHAVSVKNGSYQSGDPILFSVTIACSGGVQGQEDIACGVQIVDLDVQGDGRVPVPDAKYTVKPHPSGRLRFDFSLPDMPPGRYKIAVAFGIRDGRSDPKSASGEFEVRPAPGYVPPGNEVPSGPAPISMPQRPDRAAPLAERSGDAPSGPGADVVRLFGGSTDPGSVSDPSYPMPIAPSISEEFHAPTPSEPADDRDTKPAPRLVSLVAVEHETTGDVPPPPLLVMPLAPSSPATSPTLTPAEPHVDVEPEVAAPPQWNRPADVDDRGPAPGWQGDPYLPGAAGGEDLPSFGGEKPPSPPSPIGLWFERAVEAIRKDSYTAYMVILVGALALILLVFALVTLF